MLIFTSEPSNAATSASLGSIAVTVEDASGNTITSSTASITLTIGNNAGPGAVLSGTATASAVSGVATFPGLSINLAGTGYTLTASSASLTGATSSAFNLSQSYFDQFAYSSDVPNSATANATVTDSSGNVYAAGSGQDSSGTNHWVVRKFSGGSWSTIDDYVYPAGNEAQAFALTTDSFGNVYAAGQAADSSGTNRWVVRKFNGGSWSTIDDYVYPPGNAASASALTSDSSGNIYAAGEGIDSSNIQHWVVREYSGGSWSTIDDYVYPAGNRASASVLTSDSSGNVYAAGQAADGSGNEHWVVRRFSGGSWSMIDDYVYPAGSGEVGASALSSDSSGNVYAAGFGFDSSFNEHWVVRKFSSGSWSTIDDYVYPAGNAASALALTSDSSGNVYAAGFGFDSSGSEHWVVREYNGGSWSTIDDYVYPPGNGASASALSSDSSGNVYTAGVGEDSSFNEHWVVRKYSGGSWSTIDDYLNLLAMSAATALTSDSSGNVYAAGDGTDSSKITHWVVRKFSGGSWSTIDNYVYPPGNGASASALTTDSSGNVYAAGVGTDSSNIQHWVVRKFSGGSWSTIDDYVYPAGNGASVSALSSDSSGNIYAAGSGQDSSFNEHWVVRKFSGGSWSTIDDYVYPAGNGASALALTTDSSGNIYAAGAGFDSPFTSHWVVREYSGGSWSTIDDYLYPAGNDASASALTTDSSGNIYAAGQATDGSGTNHWIVRKLSGGSWSGVQDYQLDSGFEAQANVLVSLPTSGEVVSCGSASDSLGNQFWITQTVP